MKKVGMLKKIIRRLSIYTLRICVKILPDRYAVKKNNKEKRIIVSLATFRDRYEVLPTTLKSLFYQIKKPDKILVWIDDDPQSGALPEYLLQLCKYGVEFRKAPDDIKPHKKYFYTMQEYPSDIVITVDDDVIYPPTLISSLYKSYLKYPDCVHARRVHKIVKKQGKIVPYSQWEIECTSVSEPSFDLFAVGVGGVLYPPHWWSEKLFDLEKIKEMCLFTDDIWLKFNELDCDIKVVWVKCLIIHPPVTDGSQTVALNYHNVEKNRNDLVFNNLESHYSSVLKKIKGTVGQY